MRFIVTPLRDRGVKIPNNKKLKSFTGDLTMITALNSILRRNVCEAMLHDADGSVPLDPIIDAQITSMASDVMILRGTEYHQTRRGMVEYIQEWAVRTAEGKQMPVS